MKDQKKIITLAMETGIGGGSLAIFRDSKLLAEWIGNAEVSKSEDILKALDKMFAVEEFKKKDISKIVISEQPGSITGLRIGMAIALGIKSVNTLEIEKRRILDDLFNKFCIKEKQIVAVKIGRERYVWSYSDKNKSMLEKSGTLEELLIFLQTYEIEQVITPEIISELSKLACKQTSIGLNLSKQLILPNASDNI